MIPIIRHPRCALVHGDAAQLGSLLAPASVHAIVTDPPAGISFMGKAWDSDRGGRDQWVAWLAALLGPALDALKPGGHALVWAIPRTSHWTALALELAGFEIRDVHHHIFGTGFPKSLTHRSAKIPRGAGTALKPAVEHWILARRPCEGTVSANLAKHGTGVLNIDACRVGIEERPLRAHTGRSGNVYGAGLEGSRAIGATVEGRWPAHLSLEHGVRCAPGACVVGCPVRVLDEQSGIGTSAVGKKNKRSQGFATGAPTSDDRVVGHDDTGGASRFFYVAKGSRSEKDAGLAHLAPKTGGEATGRTDGSAGTANPRAGAGRTGGARNYHPTVKSIALMRWLIRLITPPGGIVLDMFAGSGTTGVAALAEGRRFVGIEQSGEYIRIAEGRIRHALAAGAANDNVGTQQEMLAL